MGVPDGQAAHGRSESVVNGDGVACFSANEDVLPGLYCADSFTCGFCVSGFALVGEGGVQCYGRAGLSFGSLRAGITFFALWPLCTLRAALALNALRPLLTTRACLALWASGSGSTSGALWALLTLRADRADGALRALFAFEVTVCNAVLQLLQTVGGFLSALVCIARTGGGFIGCGSGMVPSSVPELALTRYRRSALVITFAPSLPSKVMHPLPGCAVTLAGTAT